MSGKHNDMEPMRKTVIKAIILLRHKILCASLICASYPLVDLRLHGRLGILGEPRWKPLS